jgi:hypothetical protein
MAKVPTPNYVLTEEVKCLNGAEWRSLPAGSFVRPILLRYLPQHILDAPGHTWFDPSVSVYCFTRYGIIPVEKNKIREA